MPTLRTQIVVVFYAPFPDDDDEADARADEIADAVQAAVERLPFVVDGSTEIADFDTRDE